MKSFVLFNNKGGVGKTTLTFNIAHMMARKGQRVVLLDFDPQCNLTALFLDEDALIDLWEPDDPASGLTVAACVDPVRRGRGGIREPLLREVADRLWLLPGHLSLGRFEQPLAEEWPKAFASDNERALDVTIALAALSERAAEQVQADLAILDVGPSLGALNRSAILGCDAVIVPVAPDLFSLQGLRNVGPTLIEWRRDWSRIVERRSPGASQSDERFPEFHPLGYLVQQHLARADRPVKAYGNWASRIPAEFARWVLEETVDPSLTIDSDPRCIGKIKHFASLAPFAHTARKPMFDLKQADGIGGGQIQAVARCRLEFEALTTRILSRLEDSISTRG